MPHCVVIYNTVVMKSHKLLDQLYTTACSSLPYNVLYSTTRLKGLTMSTSLYWFWFPDSQYGTGGLAEGLGTRLNWDMKVW